MNDDKSPIFFTTPSVRKEYSGFHFEFDDSVILKQQTHFTIVIFFPNSLTFQSFNQKLNNGTEVLVVSVSYDINLI
jgi:hypothetical protein